MRSTIVYKVSGYDSEEGTRVFWFTSSEAARKYEKAMLRSGDWTNVNSEEIKVPMTKRGLVRFLNINFSYDNDA